MWSALISTVQVNATVIKFTLPTQFPQTMLSYLASVSYNWEDLNRFVLAHGYSCIVCASCNMITRGIIENNKQTKQKPVPGRPLSPATARANLLCLVAENWCVFSSCVCVCVCFNTVNLAGALLCTKPLIFTKTTVFHLIPRLRP